MGAVLSSVASVGIIAAAAAWLVKVRRRMKMVAAAEEARKRATEETLAEVNRMKSLNHMLDSEVKFETRHAPARKTGSGERQELHGRRVTPKGELDEIAVGELEGSKAGRRN